MHDALLLLLAQLDHLHVIQLAVGILAVADVLVDDVLAGRMHQYHRPRIEDEHVVTVRIAHAADTPQSLALRIRQAELVGGNVIGKAFDNAGRCLHHVLQPCLALAHHRVAGV